MKATRSVREAIKNFGVLILDEVLHKSESQRQIVCVPAELASLKHSIFRPFFGVQSPMSTVPPSLAYTSKRNN